MKTKLKNQKGIAPVAILIIVVLLVVGYFAYQYSAKKVSPLRSLQTLISPKSSGMIISATTTKTIDPNTGAPGQTITIFSPKDPVIYAVLKVNNPPKGIKFEYVRYYDGKYVDHGSLETTRDKVDYISFSWKLKNALSIHLTGDYKVKLYTNGNFEKEISYQVR